MKDIKYQEKKFQDRQNRIEEKLEKMMETSWYIYISKKIKELKDEKNIEEHIKLSSKLESLLELNFLRWIETKYPSVYQEWTNHLINTIEESYRNNKQIPSKTQQQTQNSIGR